MLKAGFSRVDITPPLGDDIAGYFVKRLADGVLDPLYVNTIALQNGEDTLILMAADCMAVMIDAVNKIKAVISERTGVPEDNILFSALHQHTGPQLGGGRAGASGPLGDMPFIDVVMRKFADGAQMAIDDLREAGMSTALTEVAEPISFVRRYFTDDGKVKTNPNTDEIKIVGRCSEADNTVRVVRFHREGANDIALINFSTHPDVIGGTKWSADWPGFTRRFVEEELEGVSAVFFTGTQGDTNHIDYFKPNAERFKETPYQHSEYMGRVVADAVISVWDKTEAQSETALSCESRIIYNKTNTEGIEYYDDAVAYEKEYVEKSTEENWGKLNIKSDKIISIAHARRIIALRNAPIFRPIPLMVVSIGNVVVVGFGGEPFTEYSRIVKRLAPDKFTMTTINTNGYTGYYPSTEAFKQGGYEVDGSLFSPDIESQITEAIEDMLKNI